jgi:hypothetical protein
MTRIHVCSVLQIFILRPCDCNLGVITQWVYEALAFHISKKIACHRNFLCDTLDHIGTCFTRTSTRTVLL